MDYKAKIISPLTQQKKDTVSSTTRNGTRTTARFSVEKQWRLTYPRCDGRFSNM